MKVSIIFSAHGRGEVYIDGKKLDRVQSVAFAAGVDEANLVTISLVPEQLELESEQNYVELDHGDSNRPN